jgi:hypothetical protein
LEHHMWWTLCSLFQWVEVKGNCSLRLLMVGLLAIAVLNILFINGATCPFIIWVWALLGSNQWQQYCYVLFLR